VTTLVFFLAMPNSQTQPTTHTEYPHTPTDSHALQDGSPPLPLFSLSLLPLASFPSSTRGLRPGTS